MKENYEGFITPKDGQLTFDNRPERNIYEQFLQNHEGKDLWMTIETKTPTRTNRQLRFYWVFLEKIAEETGSDPNRLHTTFKHMFLAPKQSTGIYGRTYVETPSTEPLTTKEFSDYIKQIEMKTGISAPSRTRYGLGQEGQHNRFRQGLQVFSLWYVIIL